MHSQIPVQDLRDNLSISEYGIMFFMLSLEFQVILRHKKDVDKYIRAFHKKGNKRKMKSSWFFFFFSSFRKKTNFFTCFQAVVKDRL